MVKGEKLNNNENLLKLAGPDINKKIWEHDTLVRYARFLRGVADRDYITARICYRSALVDNFLWCSLQALEKYLKATLLFNSLTKIQKYKHNINKLMRKLEGDLSLDYNFTACELEFIKNVNDIGSDRYGFEIKAIYKQDIFVFDSCVWKVRMFCRKLHADFYPNESTVYNKIPVARERYKEVTDGYLEGLWTSTSEVGRLHLDALCWMNSFFSDYQLPKDNCDVYQVALVPNWIDKTEKMAVSVLEEYIIIPPKLQTTSPNHSSSNSSRRPGQE